MEIRVSCTHCGKVLLVNADSAARVGICPNCHNKVMIDRLGPNDTPKRSADTPSTASVPGKTKNTPGQIAPPLSSATSANASDTKTTARSDSNLGADGTVVDISTKERQTLPAAISAQSLPATLRTADPLTEIPDAVWFVRSPGGGQYGPASNQVMRIWIHEGRIGPQTIVWRAGWADWLPADRVFDSLLDLPPNQANSSSRSTSKAAEYLAKHSAMKRRKKSFVPTVLILIGLALVALIAFFIIIF